MFDSHFVAASAARRSLSRLGETPGIEVNRPANWAKPGADEPFLDGARVAGAAPMRFVLLVVVALTLPFSASSALAQDSAAPPPSADAAAPPDASAPPSDAVLPPPPEETHAPPTGQAVVTHEDAVAPEAVVAAEAAATEPTPEPTPSTPSPPTPTTPAIPLEMVVAGVPIRLTGILHASVIGTQGVQTFGQPNASAATSALNPALIARPDDANLSFQVQQTRLGLIVGDERTFRGQVEIDFIHFDNSSPTTQAFPRIRIGVLEWHFAENQRLFLGQTWDIFGNATGSLLSHSSNLVGTLFQAGNIGFMRQQLGWMGRFGDVEIALALGLQGANTGPSFNNIEESFTPTGAARVMLHVGDSPTSVIGISGLGSALRFTSAMMPDERRLALGGELFADLTFGPVNIHAEAYIAQNLANLGALNLGQGRYGHDLADVGGYASARLTLGDHAITAMVGGAGVLNPGEVVPGYTAAVPAMGMAAGTPAAVNTAAGPGMAFNMTAHVGYWYSPTRGLSIVVEPYLYYTRFVYDPSDVARFSTDRLAFGGQLVGMFQF
jgi:hypothetical protein